MYSAAGDVELRRGAPRRPSGPPRLQFSPLVIMPSDNPLPPYTGSNHGNGFFNTGVIDTNPASPNPSSVEVTFSNPGSYLFQCTIHPGMRGRSRSSSQAHAIRAVSISLSRHGRAAVEQAARNAPRCRGRPSPARGRGRRRSSKARRGRARGGYASTPVGIGDKSVGVGLAAHDLHLLRPAPVDREGHLDSRAIRSAGDERPSNSPGAPPGPGTRRSPSRPRRGGQELVERGSGGRRSRPRRPRAPRSRPSSWRRCRARCAAREWRRRSAAGSAGGGRALAHVVISREFA